MRNLNGSAVVSSGTIDDIAEIKIDETDLAIEFATSGGNALNAFEVYIKMHANGARQRIASLSADYTSPAKFIFAASGDLTVLANGTTGWLKMEHLGAIFSVIFKAKAAAGTETVTWNARANG